MRLQIKTHLLHFQEKTREQREAEVIPRISEALKHGISVLDEAFITLDFAAERKFANQIKKLTTCLRQRKQKMTDRW